MNKKLITVLLLFISSMPIIGQSNFFEDIDTNVTVAVDSSGYWISHTGNASSTLETELGYSASLDMQKAIRPGFTVGLGSTLQSPRKNPSNLLKFAFNSLYIVAKKKLYHSFKKRIQPYVKLQIGASSYSGNDDSIKGGLSYAIGAGFENKRFFSEVLNNTYTGSDSGSDIRYSLISIRSGYRF